MAKTKSNHQQNETINDCAVHITLDITADGFVSIHNGPTIGMLDIPSAVIANNPDIADCFMQFIAATLCWHGCKHISGAELARRVKRTLSDKQQGTEEG